MDECMNNLVNTQRVFILGISVNSQLALSKFPFTVSLPPIPLHFSLTHTHTCTVNLAKRPLQAALQLQLMKRAANFTPSPPSHHISLYFSSTRSRTAARRV